MFQQNKVETLSSTASLAQKGNFLRALSVKSDNPKAWIVDLGASDHMTSDASLFHEYSPSTGNFSVRIADGSLSKVAGIGSVIISKDITLCFMCLILIVTFYPSVKLQEI